MCGGNGVGCLLMSGYIQVYPIFIHLSLLLSYNINQKCVNTSGGCNKKKKGTLKLLIYV